MALISIVINADTRSENSTAEHMFNGCVNEDFLIDGVINKIKFFDGFDKEVILFIDEHNIIPKQLLSDLRYLVDTLVVRTHTHEHAFNDLNYLAALHLARGKYICHFDQDTAAFRGRYIAISSFIKMLDFYSFVSYPSHWYPRAVHDESFGKRTWASTRFFMCKRETLKFDVLRACIDEPEWAYKTFGDSPRRCNWLEHFLSLSNNDSVYYPPMNSDDCRIFSWGNYKKGTLNMLNKMKYEDVVNWIAEQGGINYPVDVTIK